MSPRAELLIACQELHDAFTRIEKLRRRYGILFPPGQRDTSLTLEKWLHRYNNSIEHQSVGMSGQPSTPDDTLSKIDES